MIFKADLCFDFAHVNNWIQLFDSDERCEGNNITVLSQQMFEGLCVFSEVDYANGYRTTLTCEFTEML